MRLMFIYYVMDDAGSAQDIYNYTRVAQALGHEIAVYGRPDAHSSFNFSLDIESADAPRAGHRRPLSRVYGSRYRSRDDKVARADRCVASVGVSSRKLDVGTLELVAGLDGARAADRTGNFHRRDRE